MAENETYGDRFQALWNRQGWSRAVLLARLRRDTSRLSNILRMADPPRLNTLRAHAKALGVQPSELVQGVLTTIDKIRRGDYDDPSAQEVKARRHAAHR